jgi:hypothetical protein
VHWDGFCQILIETDQKFKLLCLDLPQYQSFLKKSNLVISFGTIQLPFKKDLKPIAMSRILKDSEYKDNLLSLNDIIERLYDDQKTMARQKRNEGLKEITYKLARAKSEFSTFRLQELEVQDGVDIQLIFPTVNIEAIQAVKNNALVRKDKTCLCRVCIRAFLF